MLGVSGAWAGGGEGEVLFDEGGEGVGWGWGGWE